MKTLSPTTVCSCQAIFSNNDQTILYTGYVLTASCGPEQKTLRDLMCVTQYAPALKGRRIFHHTFERDCELLSSSITCLSNHCGIVFGKLTEILGHPHIYVVNSYNLCDLDRRKVPDAAVSTLTCCCLWLQASLGH